MAGIASSPGAQSSSIRFSGSFGRRAVTAKGDIQTTGASVVRSAIADAHTSKRKTMIKHQARTVALALLADQNLEFLDGMEDAEMVIVELNGRIIQAKGVANVTEAGRTENTTGGETEAFTFMCDELVVEYA